MRLILGACLLALLTCATLEAATYTIMERSNEPGAIVLVVDFNPGDRQVLRFTDLDWPTIRNALEERARIHAAQAVHSKDVPIPTGPQVVPPCPRSVTNPSGAEVGGKCP